VGAALGKVVRLDDREAAPLVKVALGGFRVTRNERTDAFGVARSRRGSDASTPSIRRSLVARVRGHSDPCTEKFFVENTPPDPAEWSRIVDPTRRITTALRELYTYFGDHEGLVVNVWRDYVADPERVGQGFATYLGAVRGVLAVGWKAPAARRKTLSAAIAHATSVETWQSLVREQGLRIPEAVDLMVALTRHAAVSRRGSAPAAVRRKETRAGEDRYPQNERLALRRGS
jgi:hypothetical protein